MNRIDQISGIVQAVKKHIDNRPILSLGEYTINKIIITGKLYRSNKRFKSVYDADYESFNLAMYHTNLWNGSVWGIDAETGKRHLLKRVKN